VCWHYAIRNEDVASWMAKTPEAKAGILADAAKLWCIPGFPKNQWTHALKMLTS